MENSDYGLGETSCFRTLETSVLGISIMKKSYS